ncbi:hypothetical protein Tco_1146963 [Tanacetum coccineum]
MSKRLEIRITMTSDHEVDLVSLFAIEVEFHEGFLAVKGWLDEDLDNYHLKELCCSTQCHTQMSMWIISRGVVLLIFLMLSISFKFGISSLLQRVVTAIADRIRRWGKIVSHKNVYIQDFIDFDATMFYLEWFVKYSANVRRTLADFSHAPLNEYSPSPNDKKQWSLVNFAKKESIKKAFQDMLHGLGEVNPTHAYYNDSRTSKDNEDPSCSTRFKTRRTQKTSSALEALLKTLYALLLYLLGILNFTKKESMKKAFQDMLHGLGEVNPTHAYYNDSRTSKDNEDPSCSTRFKTRRTQKTSSALEVLLKTLYVLLLYLLEILNFAKKESMKKAFQDMLHGLGEVNPMHAYYNDSRTSKDNEDPSCSTRFKTRRTQKTYSALEALLKTLYALLLYLLGILNFAKKESMKKAFQDMLHGLGEVNPTHAYYNDSRTSKDNEDPSCSTRFKTRRTQKTSSALEALLKTLNALLLYLLGIL